MSRNARIWSLTVCLLTPACEPLQRNISVNRLSPTAPRLFYVGTNPWITFDGQQPVRITVGGYGLKRATIKVSAEATSPLDNNSIKTQVITDQIAHLVIPGSYFQRVRDKDVLTLTVTLENNRDEKIAAAKDGYVATQSPLTRHLVMRDASVFRESVLSSVTPYNDVRAFPMSSGVVKEVFGSRIDENYYVVAIRVYNRTTVDRVITSGMISANGRLIGISDNEAPAFSKPVQVSPVRSSLAYANVDGRRDYTFRNVLFRSLKFIGALATASAEAFTFNGTWRSTISIFTGIAIPEGEKVYPDPTSRYLANIVVFGMPDVVKVAAGASAGGVLFFAKQELHSMIGQTEYMALDINNATGSELVVQPKQYIAGLEVNSLNVTFENTINPADLDALGQRADILSKDGLVNRAALEVDRDSQAVSQLWNAATQQLLAKTADAANTIAGLNVGDAKLSGTPAYQQLLAKPANAILSAKSDMDKVVKHVKPFYDKAVQEAAAARSTLVDYMTASSSERRDSSAKLEARRDTLRDALGALRQAAQQLDQGRSLQRSLDTALGLVESFQSGVDLLVEEIRENTGDAFGSETEAKKLIEAIEQRAPQKTRRV